MGDYDTTAKHLIHGGPRDWLTLAGLPAPRGSVTVIDAELSTITKAADQLLRVGGKVPYLAHVEFQASPDRYLDHRVLVYNVLARWRHRLPVRSVVYLLRPSVVTRHLTGGVRESLDEQSQLAFDYRLVRVWELPVDDVLAGGLGTLPLAPIAAVEKGDLPRVVRQVRDRLTSELEAPKAAELWTATGILMTLRYRRSMVAGLLEGVRTMRESWLYRDIKQEGLAEGLLEGRVAGRVEGLHEGRLDGERSLLTRQATHKFGEPVRAVRARLDAIVDVAELERLGLVLLTAESWEELLGDRPKRRRR